MEKKELEIKKHTIIRVMDCPKCYMKHGEMQPELCDYDWGQAHEYASWKREDVAEIIAMDEGENDGPSWIACFKLKNGKYAGLNAWCDYTGWD